MYTPLSGPIKSLLADDQEKEDEENDDGNNDDDSKQWEDKGGDLVQNWIMDIATQFRYNWATEKN